MLCAPHIILSFNYYIPARVRAQRLEQKLRWLGSGFVALQELLEINLYVLQRRLAVNDLDLFLLDFIGVTVTHEIVRIRPTIGILFFTTVLQHDETGIYDTISRFRIEFIHHDV